MSHTSAARILSGFCRVLSLVSQNGVHGALTGGRREKSLSKLSGIGGWLQVLVNVDLNGQQLGLSPFSLLSLMDLYSLTCKPATLHGVLLKLLSDSHFSHRFKETLLLKDCVVELGAPRVVFLVPSRQ